MSELQDQSFQRIFRVDLLDFAADEHDAHLEGLVYEVLVVRLAILDDRGVLLLICHCS